MLASQEKQELRKHIRKVLGNLTAAQVSEQSELVCSHALAWLAQQREAAGPARVQGVSVFLSRPVWEVQTTSLCRELLKQGARVYVPVIRSLKTREMDMVEIEAGEQFQNFPKDKWGIPVVPFPDKRSIGNYSAIELVFTPGVAFDLKGRRMGNGGGFYDTFFDHFDKERQLHSLPKLIKIGLALNEMVAPSIPMDDHDVILNGIITPDGVHFVNSL
jgi:5,10-methenyltetrahydrofolate synthetase